MTLKGKSGYLSPAVRSCCSEAKAHAVFVLSIAKMPKTTKNKIAEILMTHITACSPVFLATPREGFGMTFCVIKGMGMEDCVEKEYMVKMLKFELFSRLGGIFKDNCFQSTITMK